jgi:hypothetical protein
MKKRKRVNIPEFGQSKTKTNYPRINQRSNLADDLFSCSAAEDKLRSAST